MSLSQPRDERETWLSWFENFKAADGNRDAGGWTPTLGYKTLDALPPRVEVERVTIVERCRNRDCRKIAARFTAPDELRVGGWQRRPCCADPVVVLPVGRALERRVARERERRIESDRMKRA
ncbi:hypothetical protein ACWDTP_04545 [Mycobacterium sp. NPDC003449]